MYWHSELVIVEPIEAPVSLLIAFSINGFVKLQPSSLCLRESYYMNTDNDYQQQPFYCETCKAMTPHKRVVDAHTTVNTTQENKVFSLAWFIEIVSGFFSAGSAASEVTDYLYAGDQKFRCQNCGTESEHFE
jgi:hypothetical protein